MSLNTEQAAFLLDMCKLNFFKDGKIIWSKAIIEPLGLYWESLNKANSWGGNGVSLVDTPHFSRGSDGKPEFRRITD